MNFLRARLRVERKHCGSALVSRSWVTQQILQLLIRAGKICFADCQVFFKTFPKSLQDAL